MASGAKRASRRRAERPARGLRGGGSQPRPADDAQHGTAAARQVQAARQLRVHAAGHLVPRAADPRRASDILDKIARKGEVDFVEAVSAELPLQVIADLLGVPTTTAASSSTGRTSSSRLRRSGLARARRPRRSRHGGVDVHASSLVEVRKDAQRARPGVHPDERPGRRLPADGGGFDAFFLMLTVAGNETTRNLITGGMLAL